MKFTLVFAIFLLLACGGMEAARPCVCPAVYQPVCGADGQTYSNECIATCAGQQVSREGSCS